MNPSITRSFTQPITGKRLVQDISGIDRSVKVITREISRVISPKKEFSSEGDLVQNLLDKLIDVMECPFKIIANTTANSFVTNAFTDKIIDLYTHQKYKEYLTEEANCELYQPKKGELVHKMLLNGEVLGVVVIDISHLHLSGVEEKLITRGIKEISSQFLQTFAVLSANAVDKNYAELHNELYSHKIRFNTDSLTSVHSRGYIRQKMEEAFTSQNTEHIPQFAFFIDVDNFKKYNENLDHTGGDIVLSWMGNLLRRAQTDFQIRFPQSSLCIGRFGGDEFYGYTNHANQTEVLDFMRELQEKFINERQDIEQKLISKRLEDTLNEGIFFDEVKFKKMLSSMPFSVSIGSHKIFSSNTAPSSGSISIDYLFSRASQYTGLLKSLRKRGGLAYNAQLDNKSQILEYSKGERLNSRRNILFMELQNVLFFWNDQMKYFRKTNRN